MLQLVTFCINFPVFRIELLHVLEVLQNWNIRALEFFSLLYISYHYFKELIRETTTHTSQTNSEQCHFLIYDVTFNKEQNRFTLVL